MSTKEIVRSWFDKWTRGKINELPIADNFRHNSPFGTMYGKKQYLALVEQNEDKFLGYSFDIHDEVYEGNKAAVRYTANQGDFHLDVSEWHYVRNDMIEKIVAYYHIGEVREERKLRDTNQN